MDTTFKKEKLGEKIKWSKIRVIFISDWEQMKNGRKINGLNITKFGRNKQANKQTKTPRNPRISWKYKYKQDKTSKNNTEAWSKC